MDAESIVVAFVMLVIGGACVVRPDILINLQILTQREIMGAKYIPSQQTYKIVRAMGVVFVLLGFMAMAELK